MTKSDLENFMVVETRDGEKFMVNADEGFAFGKSSHFCLTNHNEDLTYNEDNNLDIVAVYKAGLDYQNCPSYWNSMRKIWKCKEEIVLTMQEIADKFGVSVESLKIKQ